MNKVQHDAGPSFARANRAYARFARGQFSAAELGSLRSAEASIRAAKVRLGQLQPPAAARRLSTLILDLYDADASFAHETSLLAAYLPEATKALQPLGPANKRLQRGLRNSSGIGAGARQAAVLKRYSTAVKGIVKRLRGMEPPPLLEPAHNARIRRLAKTEHLADSLRSAILRDDAPAIANQLLRFRRLGATKPPQGLTPEVIRAYNARYDAVRRKAAAVAEESAQLDNRFGGT